MTIIRKLHCDNPNCPHEDLKQMSDWIRENLPDSYTGFMVSDLDFILYNYNSKCCLLLEIKTHNTQIKNWQKSMLNNIARWIENGVDDGWIFGGIKIIKFENSSFKDGKVWLNDEEILEEKLKKLLSI